MRRSAPNGHLHREPGLSLRKPAPLVVTTLAVALTVVSSPAQAGDLCAAGRDAVAAWNASEQEWVALALAGVDQRIAESAGNCLALGTNTIAAWDGDTEQWTVQALTETPAGSAGCDDGAACSTGVVRSHGSFAVSGADDVAVWDADRAAWKLLGEAATEVVAGTGGSFAAATPTAAAVYSPGAGGWRRRPAFFGAGNEGHVVASEQNFVFRTVPGFAEVITWDEAQQAFTQLLLPNAPAFFEVRGSGGAVGYTFIGVAGSELLGVRDTSGGWSALPVAPLRVVFEDGTLTFRTADDEGVQTAHAWTESNGFVSTESDVASPTLLSQGQIARRADANGALVASPLSAMAWNPELGAFSEQSFASPGGLSSALSPRVDASEGNFAAVSFDGLVSVWNRADAAWNSSIQLRCVSVFPATLGWRLSGSAGNLLAFDECGTHAWSSDTSEWFSLDIPGFTFAPPVSLVDLALGSEGNFAVAADDRAGAWHASDREWAVIALPGAGVLPPLASAGGFLAAGTAQSAAWSPLDGSWHPTAIGALHAIASSAGNFVVAGANHARVWDESEGTWVSNLTIPGNRVAAGSEGHFVLVSRDRASGWSHFSRDWTTTLLVGAERVAGSGGDLAVAGSHEVAAYHERSESWTALALAEAVVEPRLTVVDAPEPGSLALAGTVCATLFGLAGARGRDARSVLAALSSSARRRPPPPPTTSR